MKFLLYFVAEIVLQSKKIIGRNVKVFCDRIQQIQRGVTGTFFQIRNSLLRNMQTVRKLSLVWEQSFLVEW